MLLYHISPTSNHVLTTLIFGGSTGLFCFCALYAKTVAVLLCAVDYDHDYVKTAGPTSMRTLVAVATENV